MPARPCGGRLTRGRWERSFISGRDPGVSGARWSGCLMQAGQRARHRRVLASLEDAVADSLPGGRRDTGEMR